MVDDLPLAGLTVLVTRPVRQAGEMGQALARLGATALLVPTLEIVELDDFSLVDPAILGIQAYDWLILTSVNGADLLWRRSRQLGLDPGTHFRTVALAAIGPRTAASIQAQGLEQALVPEAYVAESLAGDLARAGLAGQRVLVLQADRARATLVEQLRAAGAEVTSLAMYRTIAPPAGELDGLKVLLQQGRIHFVTFTSSSTVRHFAALFERAELAPLLRQTRIAAIGPITAGTARECLGRVDITAQEYTVAGLLAALAAQARQRSVSGP